MRPSGHIIILRSQPDIEQYEASQFFKQNSQQLQKLRSILDFISPIKYRGIGRQHFTEYPFLVDDEGVLKIEPGININDYDNLEARKLYAAYKEANDWQDGDSELCLFSFEEAATIYDAIEQKTDYEIFRVSSESNCITERAIGFDLGYFGGDFFSAIADIAIKPMWHPPDLADIDDIVNHFKRLNKHCLFDTVEDAILYKKMYLAKDRAEKEMFDDQITVIQIDLL